MKGAGYKMSKDKDKNIDEEEELEQPEEQPVAEEEVKTDSNEAEQDSKAEEKIKAAQDKADEYLLAAQRIQADFENYKRRNKNAVSEATEEGINETVKLFLPMLDNVERAVDAAKKFGDESLLKGIELLLRQVNEIFEKLDVCEIETETFDPNFHHAVMQEEAGEGVEENQIVQVFQKGYMRKGKVLRFSMVKVAK